MRTVRNALVALFTIIGLVTTVRELTGQRSRPWGDLTPAHLGIIVRDVDRAARSFEDVFGVTVPQARESGLTSWPDNPAGPVQWRVKLTSFKMGALTLELVEPLDGPGPHRAHLEKFGQGLHHLAFFVPDRPAAFAFLRGQGGTQVSPTYVDLKEMLGMTVEVAPPGAPK